MLFLSCKKENVLIDSKKPETAAVFPITQNEIELAALTKEIGSVLEEVYLNRDAFNEVNAAIYSGFEKDECISINSLLQPGSSPLYQFEAFKKMYIKPGTFFTVLKPYF